MRFNVAAAAAGAVLLAGGVNAEDQKVLKDETASSSVAESSTKAAPELPTFTVSITRPSITLSIRSATYTNTLFYSPPSSRLLSSSSSLRTGRSDGSLRTPRRTPRIPRSGRMWASGLLRSLLSTRAWRATKALLSRMPPPTTPFRPSSPRRSTPRARPWWSNTRSSCRVSSVQVATLLIQR